MSDTITTVTPEFHQLFTSIEASLAKTSLPSDKWYILAMACITASPDPEAAAQLYLHLISKPEYTTPESRQALIRRLREALFKAIIIVGVCKPIESILAISQVERPEDKDYSSTRVGWQCDDANEARAMEWFLKIYAQNATDTAGLFDAHKDFAWVSKYITYGFFLGDRQVSDDLETELVVLSAIVAQNLRQESWWHIRGTRRIGVSKEDTGVLVDTVKLIMGHWGLKLNKVPTVNEVEPDV